MRRRARGGALIGRMALICLIVASILGSLPAIGRADGDPASDVLLNVNLFPPVDAGISYVHQDEVDADLTAFARQRFPVRVAVIASPYDLGTVSPLWGKPALYAEYLQTELKLVFHGQVLVVMPDGYGLYPKVPLTGREDTALEALTLPGDKAGLASATLNALTSLAHVTGVRLPAFDRGQVERRASAGSGGEALPWVVFGAGAMLIAVAWTLSLRSRPPRLWGGPSTS